MASLLSGLPKDAQFVATVQRKSETADGQGGYTTEWVDDHEETVILGNATGKDAPIAHRKEGVIQRYIWADPGVDIQQSDRLIIEGDTYEVRTTKLGFAGVYFKALADLYEENA